MTDKLQAVLNACTFKSTELTLGEMVTAQNAQKHNDAISLLQFVALRVEGNATFDKLKPSDLFELTWTEMDALITARVVPGVLNGMKAHPLVGQAFVGKLTTH